MTKKKLFEYRKIIISVFAIALAVFSVIYFSKECSNGIKNGISFCVEVLLPSLFLFMVISSYIVEIGVADLLTAPFSIITNSLFRLPGCCMSAIVLSIIGGYPIGAKCTSSLFENKMITQKQAKKLSLFAVGAGPGFLINYVGFALLNNKNAGNILLISQSVSVVLCGIIAGHTIKSEDYSTTSIKKAPTTKSNAFVNSVRSACSQSALMCSMVVVFSAIIEIAKTIFWGNEKVCDIITGLLEITTGCNTMCGKYPLTLIGFMIGFSGICVHFQVFSIIKEIRTNKLLFFLFRIISGIITALTTYILLMLMPQSIEVFSTTTTKPAVSTSTTVWGSASLLLSGLCFLGSINYAENKEK
ncbi:MAG: hypothetical protein KBS62_02065 [Oscillospiraceae bacterium]|nr:hypothetical protein [Candidatus Ruminococcus equi]